MHMNMKIKGGDKNEPYLGEFNNFNEEQTNMDTNP